MRSLPDPEPYAALGKSARIVPRLEHGTFPFAKDGKNYELGYGALVCGNKEFAYRRHGERFDGRDLAFSVNVDGREKLKILFAPCWHLKSEECKVTSDEASQTLTVTMPYVSKETNRPETFVVRLSPNGSNSVKASWESSENGVLFYASCTDDQPAGGTTANPLYRGKTVKFGERTFLQHNRAELLSASNGTISMDEPATDFSVDADNPLAAVSVRGGAIPGQHRCHESLAVVDGGQVDRWDIGFMRGLAKTGSLVFDLHDVAQAAKKSLAPVGGVDFWKSDGFHYATSPTRNLFRNPSFERGLLYWNFTVGGANFTLKEDPVRYAVEEGGLFGKHCLHLRPFNRGVQGLRTFPMALDAGKRYTLSCYVKPISDQSVKIALQNAAKGGPIKTRGPWGDDAPDSRHAVKASDGWTRIQRTFTGDGYGLIVHIDASDCLFDGFQLEEGEQATEFVAPPLDAFLDTGKTDNYVYAKDPMDLKLVLTGDEKVRANLVMTISDIYGETIARENLQNLAPGEKVLKKNIVWPYTGPFRVRFDITPIAPKGRTYTQYERFTVVDPLENRHPTKNLFACFSHADLQSRGPLRQQRLMEWGFGSTTWIFPKRYMEPDNAMHVIFPRFRFQNLVSTHLVDYAALFFPEEKDAEKRKKMFRELTDFTPEQLKIIETSVYEALKDVPPEAFPVVSFGNEEESSPMINGATDGGVAYGKAQFAFYKGAKRANPKFLVAPTCGTSGWSKLRGRKAYDQYLNAANLNGFKYDAVTVHPYGNIDGGTLGREDADLEIQYMQELLRKHGYDPYDTPIYLTESYNHTVAYVPEWNCGPLSQDGFLWGKIGYDFGNREYQDACQIARMYLTTMKHWPQVKCLHCWIAPTIDAELRPRSCALAVNTIGRFFPSPKFVGEARPIGGVRASVWQQDDEAVAAIWSVNTDAEMGRGKCPKINVSFSQPVRFFDMMGNERKLSHPGEGLQLTSAPLYIKAKDAELLVRDLKNAYSTDAASCVKVVFAPNETGVVKARILNLTDREQKGSLEVDGKVHPYVAPPKGEALLEVDVIPPASATPTRRTYFWKVIPTNGGKPATGTWELSAVFAEKCGAKPDWSKVPALDFTGWHGKRPADAADLSATYRICWNERSVFVKIDVRDSMLVAMEEAWRGKNFLQNLYDADGALEVYLDCGANGRANAIQDYDDDDYRYDFAPPKGNGAGRAHVCRFVEVDHQLADGINMPTKEECRQKITCRFSPTAEGYSYELTLDQRFIEPILLGKGAAFGFALYLHDYDDPNRAQDRKGLTTCTQSEMEAQHNPHLWPTVILKP